MVAAAFGLVYLKNGNNGGGRIELLLGSVASSGSKQTSMSNSTASSDPERGNANIAGITKSQIATRIVQLFEDHQTHMEDSLALFVDSHQMIPKPMVVKTDHSAGEGRGLSRWGCYAFGRKGCYSANTASALKVCYALCTPFYFISFTAEEFGLGENRTTEFSNV
eukprot:1183552-Prorocentrum_minimum.AAC.1